MRVVVVMRMMVRVSMCVVGGCRRCFVGSVVGMMIGRVAFMRMMRVFCMGAIRGGHGHCGLGLAGTVKVTMIRAECTGGLQTLPKLTARSVEPHVQVVWRNAQFLGYLFWSFPI